MLPFYLLLGLLIALSFLDLLSINNKEKTFFLYCIAAMLICFAAFRSDNPDWEVYYLMYKDSSLGIFTVSPDIGFNLLLFVLNILNLHPISMFFLVAFISVILNIKSFNKYTPYVFSCLLLYYVHNYVLKDMIQIRAGLASAISLYSLKYLSEGAKKRFFSVWLVAVSMHMSAIIVGLTYIVSKLNFSKKKMIRIVLICILIGTFFPLGQLIKNIVLIIQPVGRLAEYVAYGNSGYAKQLGIWTNFNAMKSMAFFFFCWVYYEKLRHSFHYFNLLFYSYFIGLCWMLLFNDFSIIGARISNIMFSGEPILFTMLISVFTKNSRPFYLLCIIGIATLIFYMNISPNKIVPYKFFFNPEFVVK